LPDFPTGCPRESLKKPEHLSSNPDITPPDSPDSPDLDTHFLIVGTRNPDIHLPNPLDQLWTNSGHPFPHASGTPGMEIKMDTHILIVGAARLGHHVHPWLSLREFRQHCKLKLSILFDDE
jgi:hypothetical protein